MVFETVKLADGIEAYKKILISTSRVIALVKVTVVNKPDGSLSLFVEPLKVYLPSEALFNDLYAMHTQPTTLKLKQFSSILSGSPSDSLAGFKRFLSHVGSFTASEVEMRSFYQDETLTGHSVARENYSVYIALRQIYYHYYNSTLRLKGISGVGAEGLLKILFFLELI